MFRARACAVAMLFVSSLLAGCVGGETPAEEKLSTASVAEAAWTLGAAELPKREMRPDESLTIKWAARNTGSAPGEVARELRVNGEVVATLMGNADVGGAAVLEYEFRPTGVGTYVLTLDGVQPVSVVVRKPAIIELARFEVAPQKVHIGDTVTITYEVANAGGAPGLASFDVILNGRTVRTEEVNLDAGKSASRVVQLTIDQRGPNVLRMGDHEEQVLAVAPAKFSFGNLTLPPGPVPTGSPVAVLVDVTNVGDEGGSTSIDLKIDRIAKVSKTQTLAAGEKQRVELTWTPAESGVYSVSISDLPAQTLIAKKPAAFSLAELAVSPTSVEIDQLVTARIVVKNTGELEGTTTVRFLVDRAIKSERPLKLLGGQQQTIEFQWSSGTPSTYELGFDGAGSKQVKVLKPAKAVFEPFTLTASALDLGDVLKVNGAVRNSGEVAATFSVPLKIDGAEVTTAMVYVEPGATVAVPELSYQVLTGGSHTVTLGDLSPKTITVRAPALAASATDEGSSWDRYVNFYFTVKNNGDGVARNVMLRTWGAPEWNDPRTISFGDLQPGQTVTKTVQYVLFGGDGGCTYHDIYYVATPTYGAATPEQYRRYCQ